jgi:hypothetical protein
MRPGEVLNVRQAGADKIDQGTFITRNKNNKPRMISLTIASARNP